MAQNFYAIFVRWATTPMTTENIQKVDNALTPLGDWLRFSGSNWLLATDHSANDVFKALGTIMQKDDSELIIRADPRDYSGWAAKWVDNWIASKQNL